jgi:phage repressor protein C with HTH and peptisase S24 domain
MKYCDIQITLQKLMNQDIKQSTIAQVLGITRQNMDYRIKSSKADVTPEEINLLERYFNVSLFEETIEVDYIHIKPSCGKGTVVLSEADVTPVKIGTQLIQSILKVVNPNTLKLFKACGDSMESVIEDGDVLLVDTARTDYNNGGVFLLTINNDWFVKRLRLRITGELDIISDNQKYPIETLKPDTDIELQIKGRVIKNLSRGL